MVRASKGASTFHLMQMTTPWILYHRQSVTKEDIERSFVTAIYDTSVGYAICVRDDEGGQEGDLAGRCAGARTCRRRG